ncbi:MAG TPA: energy transducer TonB, partial [Steroidobacteraceae bacterium]|nr:energy transducer TonB [Steroidobacteraceae bacterium]
AIERGQLVAFIPIPIDQTRLTVALGSAYEETNARVALLGEQAPPKPAPNPQDEHLPMAPMLAMLAVQSAIGLLISAASILYQQHLDEQEALQAQVHVQSATPSSARDDASSAPTAWTGPERAAPGPAASPSEAVEAKVDALIEQAQHAMRDRHFIDPAEGSALALYRSALALDPSRGEAKQGLRRLAEVLVARVQSALEERQFDVALQALETVRSIDAGDKRLPALDERIAKMRAELGPAEIQAAINAQNFDRAAQLIELATRSKSINEAKLTLLREDLRRRRADAETGRLVGLIETRMQKDQLIDPPGDSAAYYLGLAHKAGATGTELQAQSRELSRRLSVAAHAAIAQQRFDDAEHLAGELRNIGVPLSQVTALERDIGLARAQRVSEVAQQPRFADLVRTRLAQGSVVEPPDDSALHYLSQLRATDPQNASLAQLSSAVQTQILSQAHAALDAAAPAKAQSLLDLAASLGPSSDADALRDRLRNPRPLAPIATGPQEVPEASLTRTRTLEIEYPMAALSKRIEGSAEVAYTVTPKGTVSDLRVVASDPPGTFEKAATAAVARLRYKPVLNGNKPVAVSTKILLKFRLEK